MRGHGYPETRARIAPAPIHPNEAPELADVLLGRRFIDGSSVTPAGGNVGHVQLFNPAGSNVVVIIDQVEVVVGGATQVLGRYSTVELAASLVVGLDLLDGSRSAHARVQVLAAAAAAGTIAGDWSLEPRAPLPLPRIGVTLRPGHGFHFQAVTAATIVRANFRWRELVDTALDRF